MSHRSRWEYFRIGRKNHLLPAGQRAAFERAKNFRFGFELFDDGLNHQIRVRHRRKFCCDPQPRQRFCLFFRRQAAFFRVAPEAMRNFFRRSPKNPVRKVAEGHGKSMPQENLGNAVAHGAGADDPHSFN